MLLGLYTSKNITSVVIATVKSYNIIFYIAYTTIDNVLNNNTFTQYFYNYLDKD
jgi:diphthamide biosynthesis methyltransferase